MATEEPSYTSLPLEERLVHKVWKARLEAYQEITNQFQKSPNEESEVFRPYLQSPDLFKKIVTDSNVVAQESGIAALLAFLEYGGSNGAIRLRSHVVPGLCEKGLSSARAGTKQKTIDALLWLIELDTPAPVIELMIPSLSAKLPKLVSGTVKALADIYASFGAQTVNPKLVLSSLPKLYSHADRAVRAETSNLTVELFKWMGPALEQVLFPELKPVQQKDLTTAFEKVKNEKPTQQRLLRSQREALEAKQANGSSNGDNDDGDSDVIMGGSDEPAPLDPYDLMDPVDVLSKLPDDLAGKVSVPKWKDRVDVLTEVHKELKVIRLADGDYQELVRILAKCVKDVNIQVVSLASNSIESLANGLRNKFHRYYQIVLNPLLERTKEKKQSVLDALNGALDAVFQSTSLSDILDDTIEALKHKTPPVRLASCKFLIRCLKETTVAPTRPEIESIITGAIKLVGDTLPDIRTSAFEAVGTLMKITGERELNAYLEKVDDIKKTKIKEFFDAAEVKSKLSASKPKPTSSNSSAPSSGRGAPTRTPSTASKRKSLISKPASSVPPTSQLKKKPLASSSSTIPSKRGPTSPLKSSNANSSRISTLGNRGLTGRSLQSASTVLPPVVDNGLSEAERAELIELRQAKQLWIQEKEKFNYQMQESISESSKLMKEIDVLSNKLERLNDQHTSDIMTIKSKDTQLQRAHSDLEIGKLKISQLENEIELIQKQKNISQFSYPSSTSFNHRNFDPITSTTNTNDRFRQQFSPLHESNGIHKDGDKSPQLDLLDKKVGDLTIDSEHKENSLNTSRSILDTNDESWKRAAEVTSQLKARIEKMKAKSRTSAFRNNV